MMTVEFTSRHIKMGRGFRAMARRRLMSRLRKYQTRVGLINLHLQKMATSEDEKRFAVTITVELRPVGLMEVKDFGSDPIAAYENTEVILSQAILSNVAYLRRHRTRETLTSRSSSSTGENPGEFGFGKKPISDRPTPSHSHRRSSKSEVTK